MSKAKRSRKAADDSPAGTTTESFDLSCGICFELMVDATQTACCGGGFCRACIKQVGTCPLCRAVLNAGRVLSDARAERLSAVKLRSCTHKWCRFTGNRAELAAHTEDAHVDHRALAAELREQLAVVRQELKQAKMPASDKLVGILTAVFNAKNHKELQAQVIQVRVTSSSTPRPRPRAPAC